MEQNHPLLFSFHALPPRTHKKWLFHHYKDGTAMILKRNKPVAFCYQTVEIDLFRPLMVQCLHAVKVKQFPSGKKNPLGEGKNLG